MLFIQCHLPLRQNKKISLNNLSFHNHYTVHIFAEKSKIWTFLISTPQLSSKKTLVPWGGDNQMPFNIIYLIEKNETLSTCQDSTLKFATAPSFASTLASLLRPSAACFARHRNITGVNKYIPKFNQY